jgi:hypothetical protein
VNAGTTPDIDAIATEIGAPIDTCTRADRRVDAGGKRVEIEWK